MICNKHKKLMEANAELSFFCSYLPRSYAIAINSVKYAFKKSQSLSNEQTHLINISKTFPTQFKIIGVFEKFLQVSRESKLLIDARDRR